jgi:hypothetical protein
MGSIKKKCRNFRTFYGARDRVGLGLSYRPTQATEAGGIDSLAPYPDEKLK